MQIYGTHELRSRLQKLHDHWMHRPNIKISDKEKASKERRLTGGRVMDERSPTRSDS
jgi:hypothetical protein